MSRPTGVTILAILTLLGAVSEMVWAIAMGWRTERGNFGQALWISWIGPSARLLLGLLYGLVGIGLWKLRNWARHVVIVLSAIAIAAVAFNAVWGRRLTGFSVALWILIPVAGFYVVCLGYMLTRNVKQAFSG